MDSLFFGLDIIGIVLVVYWSVMNDKRGHDVLPIGLFAYREHTGRAAKKIGTSSTTSPGQDSRRSDGILR